MTKKRVGLITNVCIACVLIGLGVAVWTADLSNLFITVGAPIYNGDREGGKVSLMFVIDDGVDADSLNGILKILRGDDTGIKTEATFFIGAKWADRNIENRNIVKTIARDFEIGNHASSNKSLGKMSEKQQYNEILLCHATVYTITAEVTDIAEAESTFGVEMNLFLPPNGNFNTATLKSAEKLGYRTVKWSRDARGKGVFTKAVGAGGKDVVAGGDFVLFEPSAETWGRIGHIVADYRDVRGLKIVPVSQNIVK